MHSNFEITAGTIPGRRHVGNGNLLVGKNNQDAYGVLKSSQAIALAVFDGCSSGAHSEVGAKIASNVVLQELISFSASCPDSLPTTNSCWRKIKESIVDRLKSIAAQMALPNDSQSWARLVHDYFLFTICGALITEKYTIIYSIGDGVFCANGKSRQIGPYEGNSPPYIGYAMLPDPPATDPDFVIQAVLRTEELESLLIGTDGAVELRDKQGCRLPGKLRPLDSLGELSSDTFFAHEHALTCWLRQVNSEVTRLQAGAEPSLNREYGMLSDDTTLIIARRRR